MTNKRPICVVADPVGNSIPLIAFELIEFARQLKKLYSAEILVVVPGSGSVAIAEELANTSGLDVHLIDSPALENYNSDHYKTALVDLFKRMQPSYIVMGHTTRGMDAAPGLAIQLSAACITGVEKINFRDESICFERSVFAGKILSVIAAQERMTILTIPPGAFAAQDHKAQAGGVVTKHSFSQKHSRIRYLKTITGEEVGVDITSADVLVSIGRGIGQKENLELVEKLTKLFPRSAVSCSRPLCDQGWMEYGRQVGVTGKTVSPKLYLAIGISGSSQHLTGMKGSEFIVSVNTDPHAAICNYSDVCVTEDAISFLQTMLKQHESDQDE